MLPVSTCCRGCWMKSISKYMIYSFALLGMIGAAYLSIRLWIRVHQTPHSNPSTTGGLSVTSDSHWVSYGCNGKIILWDLVANSRMVLDNDAKSHPLATRRSANTLIQVNSDSVRS